MFNRYGNFIYSAVNMNVCMIVPICVTTFSHIKIYLHVVRSTKRLHQYGERNIADRKLAHEIMAARSQFSVFIAYLILYLPFGITCLVNTGDVFPDLFHAISLYLCFLNSCINFILYGVLNSNMRKAYLASILCRHQTDDHALPNYGDSPVQQPSSQKNIATVRTMSIQQTTSTTL